MACPALRGQKELNRSNEQEVINTGIRDIRSWWRPLQNLFAWKLKIRPGSLLPQNYNILLSAHHERCFQQYKQSLVIIIPAVPEAADGI